MRNFFDKIEKITKTKRHRFPHLNNREINNRKKRSNTLVMETPYDIFIAMARGGPILNNRICKNLFI